jgi:hypothetical protein
LKTFLLSLVGGGLGLILVGRSGRGESKK